MGFMERVKVTAADEWSPEEIRYELKDTEPELFKYLSRLPKNLWSRHFDALQELAEKHASEPKETVAEMRIDYILGILQGRESAIVEFNTNDPKIRETAFGSKERVEKFGNSLRELLVTDGNLLGFGQTARVKSMKLDELEEPIGVKYLLTPTPKTLSVDGEHDLLYEAETLTSIEGSKERVGTFEHIGVPHPYFYFKRGELQCYGMSQIDGVTVEEIFNDDGGYHPIRDKVLQTLKTCYLSEDEKTAFTAEIDTFMRTVHEVCLHGDIKPKNIMVDVSGRFYLIDFGQSVPMRTMTDTTRQQFENLQDKERADIATCIREALRRTQQASPSR
jgi:hypothetical protein